MTNTNLPFGIDISRWQYSQDGKQKLDFEQIALHKENIVRFVYTRSGVSWGYQDPWFARNWDGIGQIDRIRDHVNAWNAIFGMPPIPVGRGLYHVIYPGEDPTRQVDNLFRIVGETANWDHDRICIDAELDHGYSKRIITDCIKRFANVCKARTGRFPSLYSRTSWLTAYTFPAELTFMDLWLAQYRHKLPYPLYTPEMPCPPNPLPAGFTSWMIHQTGERGRSIGSTANHYMDYNRWNGTNSDVAEYFNLTYVPQPPTPPEPPQVPQTLEEQVADHERRIRILEGN